jgi:hypothetical protein
MDIIHNLGIGFAAALSLQYLGFCLIGVLLGTLIGVLPGIGPLATIAMLLPITFDLNALSSLIMLAGIYYGAQYGGSPNRSAGARWYRCNMRRPMSDRVDRFVLKTAIMSDGSGLPATSSAIRYVAANS